MQRGGGRHYRKAETVAGQAPALVKTVEPLDDMGPLRLRYAGAVILNYQRDGIPILGRTNAHSRPAAGVFERVVGEIREGTREQVLVAERDGLTLDLAHQGNSFGLRCGVVEFDDVVDDRNERYRREGLPAGAGLGLRDLQQPIEHPDQLVDFLNGKSCSSGEQRRAVAGAECLFEPAADTPERGSEIMGYRVGYVPDPIHQMLDAVEHAVDFLVKPREFVLHARDRNPPAEVPRLDLPSGAANGTHSVLQLPAKQQGAADREQQGHRSARRERMPNEPLDIPLILHVATDDEDRAVRQSLRQQAAERRAPVSHDR